MTRFGHFDDEAREYVITRPDTPLPWINYLGSEEYFGIISNTAGGYSFYRDARLRRLTRYRYNNVPPDAGGRYLYVRDDETGEYWSPSWQPIRADLEDYRCRHGLGYTVIGSRRAGIEAETLYFVPLGETLEIWRARVTNHRDAAARAVAVQRGRVLPLGRVGRRDELPAQPLDRRGRGARTASIFHTTEYRERRNHFAYFACSEPSSPGSTRSATRSSARTAAGTARWPSSEGRSGDSIAHGWAPIGSHHVELELAPGRDARGRLRARLRREPARREVRPARVADDRQATASRP